MVMDPLDNLVSGGEEKDKKKKNFFPSRKVTSIGGIFKCYNSRK